RIAVMRDGVLQQLDTPQQLYDHPANTFVAGFIGSPAMNFFPARLERVSDDAYLQAEGFRLRLPEAWASELGPLSGRDVTLGIRPDHLVERAGTPSDEDRTLRATLEVVENLGSESILTLRLGSTIFTSRSPYRAGRHPGETIELTVDTAHLHVFDNESGTALGKAA
ncbi:MAG: TOBE domain-containing protein, partial [Sphingomonadaceae bacterium]